MGRYSDIRRGKELNEALTKLRAWEDLPRDQKQTLYKGQRGSAVKVNANRVKGYVESFNLTGRIFLPVKILSNTQSANSTLIGTLRTATLADGRVKDAGFTPPTGAILLDGLSGFKAAKVSITDKGAEVADNKSRITDVQYKRYDNKSVSSPFGQKTDTEDYSAAVTGIKGESGIETFLNTPGNRIAFTPEII